VDVRARVANIPYPEEADRRSETVAYVVPGQGQRQGGE